MLFWFFLVPAWFVCIIFFKLRVFGRENISKKEPMVFVSNHQSYLDPFIITVALGMKLSYIARETLYKNPLFKLLTLPFDVIKIRRETPDTKAIKKAIELLHHKRSLLIFPEGTRTRTGIAKDPKMGFYIICKRSKRCMVPVYINGSFYTWRPGRSLPRMGTIKIHIARPLDISCIDKEKAKKIIERFWKIGS
jgi:1-acyl-sn-glycerol-3-phosphate acyltransferase